MSKRKFGVSNPHRSAALLIFVHRKCVLRLTTLRTATAGHWTRIEPARPVGQFHGTRIRGVATTCPLQLLLLFAAPNYARERLGSKMH